MTMAEKGSALRSFKHRNFRILFTANLVSNIGTWSQRVAQDWLVVTDLHRGGSALGIVTGLQFLPSLLFSLYSGVLADRFDKRKLLLISNLGGGLTSLILGILVIAEKVTLTHVFILAFLLGIFNALDAPVRQSFNSEVVGKSDVANAVSLNAANFNAGRLVGPAITGLMIKAFHTGPSFILNSISYLAVVIALLFMRKNELFLNKQIDDKPKISAAITYVKARPDLLAVMIIVFFAATFGLNFQIFNALISTKVFAKDAGAFGALGSILAIGALLAALISAKLDTKRNPKFIATFAILFGSSLVLISAAPSFAAYSAFLPICGLVALTTMISANSYVQVMTAANLRGRVMGIYLLIVLGGAPIGSPLIGWLSDLIGIRETIAICGAITSLAGITTYAILREKLNAFKNNQERNPN
ncbi:unannotated protein [freshwater metagenome]|uniref:Unannotated protein n=1 Tax=freshwater metagenome TaxID=449393 RepID=A0A6J6T0M6_9ZZZZ|nr:MFS transporter [Actinomycetota bacterium]